MNRNKDWFLFILLGIVIGMILMTLMVILIPNQPLIYRYIKNVNIIKTENRDAGSFIIEEKDGTYRQVIIVSGVGEVVKK